MFSNPHRFSKDSPFSCNCCRFMSPLSTSAVWTSSLSCGFFIFNSRRTFCGQRGRYGRYVRKVDMGVNWDGCLLYGAPPASRWPVALHRHRRRARSVSWSCFVPKSASRKFAAPTYRSCRPTLQSRSARYCILQEEKKWDKLKWVWRKEKVLGETSC